MKTYKKDYIQNENISTQNINNNDDNNSYNNEYLSKHTNDNNTVKEKSINNNNNNNNNNKIQISKVNKLIPINNIEKYKQSYDKHTNSIEQNSKLRKDAYLKNKKGKDLLNKIDLINFKKEKKLTQKEIDDNRKILKDMHRKLNFNRNPRFANNKKCLLYEDTKFNDVVSNQNPFAVCPEAVIFRDYEIDKIYQTTISLINKTQLLKCFKYIPPTTNNFLIKNIVYPKSNSSLIAPGMCSKINVLFKPTSLDNFNDYLTIITEHYAFKIPLIGIRELPAITIKSPMECGSCIVGSEVSMNFVCKNNGGNAYIRFEASKEVEDIDSNSKLINNNYSYSSDERLILDSFIIKPKSFYLEKGRSIDVVVEFCPKEFGYIENKLNLIVDSKFILNYCVKGEGILFDLIMTEFDGILLENNENSDLCNNYTIENRVNDIEFEDTYPCQQKIKKFKLKNVSTVNAKYHWVFYDYYSENNIKLSNEDQIFSVIPNEGMFKSNSEIEFTIMFSPKSSTFYSKKLDLVIEDIPFKGIKRYNYYYNPLNNYEMVNQGDALNIESYKDPFLFMHNSPYPYYPLQTFNVKGSGKLMTLDTNCFNSIDLGDIYLNKLYTTNFNVYNKTGGQIKFKIKRLYQHYKTNTEIDNYYLKKNKAIKENQANNSSNYYLENNYFNFLYPQSKLQLSNYLDSNDKILNNNNYNLNHAYNYSNNEYVKNISDNSKKSIINLDNDILYKIRNSVVNNITKNKIKIEYNDNFKNSNKKSEKEIFFPNIMELLHYYTDDNLFEITNNYTAIDNFYITSKAKYEKIKILFPSFKKMIEKRKKENMQKEKKSIQEIIDLYQYNDKKVYDINFKYYKDIENNHKNIVNDKYQSNLSIDSNNKINNLELDNNKSCNSNYKAISTSNRKKLKSINNKSINNESLLNKTTNTLSYKKDKYDNELINVNNNYVYTADYNNKEGVEFNVNYKLKKLGVYKLTVLIAGYNCKPLYIDFKANVIGPSISINVPAIIFPLCKVSNVIRDSFIIKNVSDITAKILVKEDRYTGLNFDNVVELGLKDPLIINKGEIGNIQHRRKINTTTDLKIIDSWKEDHLKLDSYRCLFSEVYFDLLPNQEKEVIVSVDSSYPIHLSSNIQVCVQNGEDKFVRLAANIQMPECYIDNTNILPEDIYIGTPVVYNNNSFNIINPTNIQVSFKWNNINIPGEIESKFTPSNGLIEPNSYVKINYSIKYYVIKEVNQLFTCDIPQIDLPLGVQIKGYVKGLDISYLISNDLNCISSNNINNIKTGKTNNSSTSNIMLRTTKKLNKINSDTNKILKELNFNATVNNLVIQTFIIKNNSGIDSYFSLNMQNYESYNENKISHKKDLNIDILSNKDSLLLNSNNKNGVIINEIQNKTGNKFILYWYYN